MGNSVYLCFSNSSLVSHLENSIQLYGIALVIRLLFAPGEKLV